MEPPAKRQKMLSRACESCKARKSKCDSHRPRCGACLKKNTDCVYREKGQPGLRPGYGKEVGHRLTQLEEMVRDISASLRALVPAQPAHSGSVSGSHGVSLIALNGETRDASDTASAVEFQLRSENQAASEHITNPQPDPSSHVQEPLLQNDEGFCPSTEVNVSPSGQPGGNTVKSFDNELPHPDILTELAEIFFDFAHPCNKLFHKPSFMASLFEPERQVLLHAVTVVAFRFWDKPYPDQPARERYMQTSRDRVTLAVVESLSLVSVQALAVLALDSFGTSPGPRTVSTMSLLTTAAHHLGLMKCLPDEGRRTTLVLVRNESVDQPSEPSDSEKEDKRRLFWIIFLLDRFVSLSHGSKCTLRTDTIKQHLPANDDVDWGRSPSVDIFPALSQPTPFILDSANPWRYLVEVLSLLDRTHEFLLQPVDLSLPAYCDEWQRKFQVLDDEISTWYDHLPAAIKERPQGFDAMWVMIHATYYAVIIRMHSIAAFPPAGSTLLGSSPVAAARCRQAVKALTSIFQPLSDVEIDRLGPICAFLVWIASRNLIILWTAVPERPSDALPADLSTLLDVLRRISSRWQSAQRFVDLIQLVIDTMWSDEGQGRLKIFNDTRRTAHGICSLLGQLATENRITRLDQVLDWLDIPLLDQVDNSTSLFGEHTDSVSLDWIFKTS